MENWTCIINGHFKSCQTEESQEILFKGKRLTTGEYVVSDSIIKSASKDNSVQLWTKRAGWVWVDKNTVGVYTGIQDMNGKKLFTKDYFVPYSQKEDTLNFERGGIIESYQGTFIIRTNNFLYVPLSTYVSTSFDADLKPFARARGEIVY